MTAYAMSLARFTTWLTLIVSVACAAHAADGIDIGKPFSISSEYGPGSTFMQVRLRGVLRLKTTTMSGLKLQELSALAWDADEDLLYAVSDDGFVMHLRPAFANGMLEGVRLVAAYPLLNAEGEAVIEAYRDSEGMVARNTRNGVRGDAELLVVFEVVPRLLRYSANGQYLGALPLPAPLDQSAAYSGDNNYLEALTELPDIGLVTAPERPLRHDDQRMLPLYALDGRVWHYPPIDPEFSALVGLETMPNGDLLVLERRYASMFRPVIFSLRRMRLPTDPSLPLEVSDVVRFDTSRGWAIDNFESVAWHEGANYFLISDDNDSLIQKTLLLYLEIIDPPRAQDAAPAPP